MSSNVSDQMKVPGNPVKAAEERNIPWSQQVDEASYENLSSPATDENTCFHQSAMQFQFPPFNVKESQNVSWNYQKSRKTGNNDSNKKHGKPGTFSNTKRDDIQYNAWGNQKKGKHMSDSYSNINKSIRTENMYASAKFDSTAIINVPVEEKKTIGPSPTSAPKKTTWASIASQPAKLTSRTNLSTLSNKKKGPGMPPPPMVPGRHNLDVNTWELPNNNPPPVPSPTPLTDKSFAEVNPNYTSGIGCDYEIEVHTDRSHKGTQSSSEENKANYNKSNYGRTRTSPIGNSRKNWSTQHFEHNNRGHGDANVAHRRPDDNIANCGHQTRFTDRRNNYTHLETETLGHDSGEQVLNQTLNVEQLIPASSNAVLEKLHDKNNYNPLEIDLDIAASARFFVIKSYSEDDIHRSIKYEIWCSTDHGNKRLDDAFKERKKEGGRILLFFSVNGSAHFCGMAQMITAVDYNSTSSVWSQDKWKGKFKVKWIYVKDVPNTKLRHIRLENNGNKSVTNSRDTQEVPNAKGIEVLQIFHRYKHSTSIFDDFYHYEKKQEEEVSKKYDNLSMTSPITRHHSRQSDDRDRERDSRGIGGSQKYFIGSNTSFRDRNNSYRGNFHNSFNEQRRNESHRMGLAPDSQLKERDDRTDTNIDRDNECGSRHGHQFDYTHRPKHLREREFSEKETKFRTSFKEMFKDNEYEY